MSRDVGRENEEDGEEVQEAVGEAKSGGRRRSSGYLGN